MPYKDPVGHRRASARWDAAHPEKRRALNASYRARNPEKKRAYDIAYDAAHREEKRAYRAARRLNDWATIACNTARARAKKQGVKFEMKPEDLLPIPAVCPFTLLPFCFITKNGKAVAQSPSVDRIKPDRGYVSGNVRVISYQANRAKGDITDPDLFQRLADDARLWSPV
jgi:hypothetical protein